MLNDVEITEVLSNYSLGKLSEVLSVYKNDHISFGIRVKTDSHDLFIKEFNNFSNDVNSSLKLILFLESMNFPVVKLYQTNSGLNHVKINQKEVSVFKFYNLPEKTELNNLEVFNLAKSLANLHSLILPKDIKLNSNNYSISYCKRMIQKHFKKKDNAPRRFKKIIIFLYNFFMNLEIPLNEPKSINHLEFTQEHVRFDKDEVVSVLDWDEANYDYIFYDIGNAMLSCFDKDELNLFKLHKFIQGYESVKQFSKWQKKNLDQILLFGVAINCLWNLTDPITDSLSFENKWPIDIERVEMLINFSTSSINQILS